MGHQHALTFIDQASRYAISIAISKRSEVQIVIQTNLQYIHQRHQQYPKLFHLDNAREFTATGMSTFLSDHGIAQSVICPHQPQQNSVAERCNQTIMKAARAAIHHSHLHASLWDIAIIGVTYKYDYMPHKSMV